MKLIAPEFKVATADMQSAQKVGNTTAVKEARAKLSSLQEKHGISTAASLVALVQMPFLITWFLSVSFFV